MDSNCREVLARNYEQMAEIKEMPDYKQISSSLIYTLKLLRNIMANIVLGSLYVCVWLSRMELGILVLSLPNPNFPA